MGAKEKGVAVARLRKNVAGCDHAGGGRLVLDHDTCPERLPEPVGNEARRDVGGATGAEAHHQPDRPCRIIVDGAGGARQPRQSGERNREGTRSHFRLEKWVRLQNASVYGVS